MRSVLKLLCLAAALNLGACASTLDQDDAIAVARYHIVSGGRIVVDVYVNDRGPFHFALDSGASISVVFDELRKELELKAAPGQSVVIHGLIASGRFPILDIGRLQLGTETWADPRIAGLPSETLASRDSDGILGIDFLQQYAVGFSRDDRVLRLYDPEQVREESYRGWAVVPLELMKIGSGGAALYFFDTRIDDQQIPALFDLGAGLNLINWPAARALRIEFEDPENNELLSGALANTAATARLTVGEVSTAGVRWHDEMFVVADVEIFKTLQRADSPFVIIGSGLFNQRDFVIDFMRNRLLVKVSMAEVNDSR